MPAPIDNTARSMGRVAPAEAPPPPDPTFLEGLGANFTAARDDQMGRIQDAQVEAYAPVISALDDMGLDGSQYILPVRSGAQVNYAGVWSLVQEARRRNPGALGDLPATQADFETKWRAQFQERAERTEQTAGRAGWVPRLAGGFAGAMTDPINLATMPVGGVGKTAVMRVATEALANGVIEAAQQPLINIERKAQGRKGLTGEQMGYNITGAALFGGVIRGGIEVAPVLKSRFVDTVTAHRAALPEPLRDRWDAHLLRKADPLDDPMLLSDVAEAVIGDANISELERSALVALRRDAQDDAANPFIANGAGADMHDALMSEAFRAALNANPMATSRTAIAATLRTAGREVASGDARSRFMQKVRGAESNGDDAAANPRSSARGRYQFTNGTWLHYYKKRYGSGGLTDAEIVAKKGSANLQETLMGDLTDHNAALLAQAGHATNEGNLYLAHFAGPDGARKLLDADPVTAASRVLEPAAIKANPFLKDMSAGEVIAWAHRKMGTTPDSAGLRVRGDIGGDAGEAGRIQSALDEAMGRAANLAEEQRRARMGESDPLADALDVAAVPAERTDLSDVLDGAAPTEPHAAAPDAPRPEVLSILPQLREVVAGRQSLNRLEPLARDLGVSEDDLRAGLGEMIREGRITVNRKSGNYMRKPRAPDGPEDVLDFVARNGGIRDDEGHALGLRGISERERRELHSAAIKNVKRRREAGGKRDWQRMTRRNGRLLRHEGRSIDAVGESLWEAGYLRGRDSERPTTREVLEYLDNRINGGEPAYPMGEAPAPRSDFEGEPNPWTISTHDAFGFERTPEAIARLTRERDEARAHLVELGFDEAAMDPDAIGDVLHNLSFTDASLPMPERMMRAVNMMAEDVQANAFAHSQDMDYDWFDYDANPEPRSDVGSEDFAAAPHGRGSEPFAGSTEQGGVRGKLLPEDARPAGEQLVDLSPEDRAPYLDPDGAATRAQADSLVHDARAEVARQAQETQLRADAPMRGENVTGQAQDGTMGLGLFDAADQPTFKLDEAEGERTLDDILGEIDAEANELKNIRDCL
ncbi:lysozyme family protein [Novosphingobium clariflavum]|uniref:Phage tail lysozyme domain-containing protein n=1 Tax=Novosphingobium clariflavum TaxID=2029884 RepID=A0ABV6S1W6_9SPHN|nr:hypothetical protein [Novosphingobium clariflavum]